jgi:hypothetical protein
LQQKPEQNSALNLPPSIRLLVAADGRVSEPGQNAGFKAGIATGLALRFEGGPKTLTRLPHLLHLPHQT